VPIRQWADHSIAKKRILGMHPTIMQTVVPTRTSMMEVIFS
jgi:hypothetical protein